MTNQQLYQTFKAAGFEAKLYTNCVVVSLNRPISIMEVQAVMDIPRECVKKQSSNEVLITGEDS